MDNNYKPTYSNTKRIDIIEKDGWGGSHFADPSLYGLLKLYARENRKNMTESESILWHYIRRDALGVTFLRQFIIGEYIVDFACLIPKVLIEVDGGYHSEPRQQQNDQVRQQWLGSQGFAVHRFKNEEIIGDIDGVIKRLKKENHHVLLEKFQLRS